MSKRILVIVSIITVLLGCFSVSFASNDLKIIEKQITVDYKKADESYLQINKSLVEDKKYYELEKVDRNDNLKTLTMNYEIVDTKETTTNDLEKVIEMFNPTKDIEQDGYTGKITRDNSSLKINVKDSYKEEYKVYLQKSYTNVSSNELNDIPKEIKQNDTIYYLVNPVWNIAETEKVSDNEVPVKYNGIMYYEGVKSRTIVTSYLVTVKYVGILEKQVPDTTTFTMKYKEVKEYNYIVPVIVGVTGIIFVSGIILLKLKNAKIYNIKNEKYRLIKKVHISKNKLFVDLTPTNIQTRSYKIVLSKSLYKYLKGKSITFKYFDKQIFYKVENKEFEIVV